MIFHIYGILIFIFLFGFLYILNKKYGNNEKLDIVKNYENYLAILTYHMDKAFEIIYKEKIMAYSLEAMKLDENQFKTISKDFGYLVLKMIGPGLKKSFISIYGSEESFLFNVMEYFNTKFENDEIYKSSTFDIMNKDEGKNNISSTVRRGLNSNSGAGKDSTEFINQIQRLYNQWHNYVIVNKL